MSRALSPERADIYTIVHGDAFAWLRNAASDSLHAVVTDPPYGLIEYSPEQCESERLAGVACGEYRRVSMVASGRHCPALPS